MENQNLITYPIHEIPHCKVHGRTVPGASPLPLFFNGSAVEVNVSGTELWVNLTVDYTIHEPWITCEINKELMSRQMLMPGTYDLCLFRGMNPATVKNVKVTRELQAMSEDPSCCILINAIKTDGAFSPVAPRKYVLEFVGDSITSGEGTYGAKEDVDWIPMYMSYSRNYAKMTSEALDAEAYLISQGGWGVLCGWDNNPHSNIPSRYEKLCGLCQGDINGQMGAFKPYDFTSRQPDAVIVNLGTNDASAFDQPVWHDPITGEIFQQRRNEDGTYDEACLRRFQNAVIAFLQMLRKNNPQAHIVWCYGMLGCPLSPAIIDAICQYTARTGDGNVKFLPLPDTTDETVGSHAHPGPRSHAKAAQVLTAYLREYLGYPIKTVLP